MNRADDPHVMVTGTQDVDEARAFALENLDGDDAELLAREGRAVRGVIVPGRDDWGDYSWWWYEREDGRVKAVIFDPVWWR